MWPGLLNLNRLAPAAVGLIVGAAIAPLMTLEPFKAIQRFLRQRPATELLAGTFGLLLAGVIALVVSVPLSQLPGYFGRLLPIVMFVMLAAIFIEQAVARKDELLQLVSRRREGRETREPRNRLPEQEPRGGRAEAPAREANESRSLHRDGVQRPAILMDTSAIIDGRIADISQTGFMWGELIVPRFVLQELQHIADSSDTLRRNRGRRGLEMLKTLQKKSRVPVRVMDLEAAGPDVDGKLVVAARQLHGSILTNDFNLNRVAEIQGVQVLNVNELANAVKAVVLPGEEISVQIIQEGKELGQGVAYLD
ncbi:MAG: PIN/TRAM domain-containing protein, partial [Chloroflexota bacterium]